MDDLVRRPTKEEREQFAAKWAKRTRPTADLGDDGELLLRARNLLQEADGWLAINGVVNHDELCAKIAETVAAIDAVLSRSGG